MSHRNFNPPAGPTAGAHLKREAYALIGRLKQTDPFSLSMPMVPAAAVSRRALSAITVHWARLREQLSREINQFIGTLEQAANAAADADRQLRFAGLKLRFNSLLDQFDIFADVISQRSEHKTGVWIAGLDVLAEDALRLKTNLYQVPPLMCFLERGHGAAIRKARTRLPGGDENPVAIIQVPRERLVGSGIASSLIHEAGHQGVALLGLMPSLRDAMRRAFVPPEQRRGWDLLQRWLSEILADFWALAHLGIGATLGLMGVVSLPVYFMFRVKDDDPHPFPWIRVMVSLAFGERLYPDPQWNQMRRLWLRLYPPEGRDPGTLEIIRQIEACLPAFVNLVVLHQNAKTRGQNLISLFPLEERKPDVLRSKFGQIEAHIRSSPVLTFAIIGQARADNRVSHEAEQDFLTKTLMFWARKRAESSIISLKQQFHP
ncbi:MAG TPA: hypothetical protein PLO67_04560 [Saprospiraceae bacterium]|nr:hypothetical protein [Saprospiraceae bacterium]HPI05961.1 hypothetical protein [Saprospiraceae bacterium]